MFGLLDQIPLQRAASWLTKAFSLNESVTVDLSAVSGSVVIEWFNPRAGEIVPSQVAPGPARRVFTAPFAGDAVLYLRAATPTRSEHQDQ